MAYYYYYYYKQWDILINAFVYIMQSFGSQEWDAGFAIQALLATNLIDELGPAFAKGHDFIKKSQVCLIPL